MKYYAHSLPGEPPEKWQPLAEHRRNVAELAEEFADLSCIASATQEPFGRTFGLKAHKGWTNLREVDRRLLFGAAIKRCSP